MISRGEITKRAQIDGVDAQTVERDYLLAHISVDVASLAGEAMILKGGTSLRLGHYENYRYSADLDYSLVGITGAEAVAMLGAALENCRVRMGLQVLGLDASVATPYVSFVGPLGAKPRRIKLDLADDELVLTHELVNLTVDWRDLPAGAEIRCYTLNETCAEKFRCVIQRRQCRDVYDLWNLLDERGGADLYASWHIFEQKAQHKGIDPKRFFERWDEGLDWYRKRWDAELGDYLGATTPDFGRISRVISGKAAEVRDYLAT